MVINIPLLMILSVDANTLGSIACIASIDWGCAIQVMAAASIGSGGTYVATTGKLSPSNLTGFG